MTKRTQEARNPYQPPPYPTAKTYQASDEELAEFSVPPIHVMVRDVNNAWEKKRRLPISQWDYPTSKKKFLKVVGWWKDVQSEEAAARIDAAAKTVEASIVDMEETVMPYSRANYLAPTELPQQNT